MKQNQAQRDQMKHDMGQDQTKKDDMGKDEMKSKARDRFAKVIRPLPLTGDWSSRSNQARAQERTCWQALYQANLLPSSAQEKRARGRSICGSAGLERFWSGF